MVSSTTRAMSRNPPDPPFRLSCDAKRYLTTLPLTAVKPGIHAACAARKGSLKMIDRAEAKSSAIRRYFRPSRSTCRWYAEDLESTNRYFTIWPGLREVQKPDFVVQMVAEVDIGPPRERFHDISQPVAPFPHFSQPPSSEQTKEKVGLPSRNDPINRLMRRLQDPAEFTCLLWTHLGNALVCQGAIAQREECRHSLQKKNLLAKGRPKPGFGHTGND